MNEAFRRLQERHDNEQSPEYWIDDLPDGCCEDDYDDDSDEEDTAA